MGGNRCSWCGHDRLEPGFMMEAGTPGYGRWVPGPIETGPLGGAKLLGKDRFAIHAFRCVQCSHLELFAPTQPAT